MYLGINKPKLVKSVIRPRYSVITISLDEVASVSRTADSIVGQDYSNFEWIVIDGGSVDGTLEELRRYRSDISYLVSEPDGGIYDAMNKGLQYARGEYVIFMNAGDRFASSDVLAAVDAALKSDLLVGSLDMIGSDQIRSFPKVLPGNYLLKNMLPHQSTFFRRGLFKEFGFFDTSYRIAGDYEMFARLIQSGKVSYEYLDKTIAIFDAGGVSSDKKLRQLRKRENHKVRWRYFKKYRFSLKGIRQQVRNLLFSASY